MSGDPVNIRANDSENGLVSGPISLPALISAQSSGNLLSVKQLAIRAVHLNQSTDQDGPFRRHLLDFSEPFLWSSNFVSTSVITGKVGR